MEEVSPDDPRIPPRVPIDRTRYIIDRRMKNGWTADGIGSFCPPEDEQYYIVIPIPEEDRRRAGMITAHNLDQFMSEDENGNFTFDLYSVEAENKLKRQNIHGIINERNEKIAESDWTQLADVYMDGVTRGKWNDYRRQLRDLPTTGVTYDEDFFPVSVNWPTPPQ
tara:strand:+ start:820 stop:1317 length:498 start_codon:yes stop_codon:yes gene_type:complete